MIGSSIGRRGLINASVWSGAGTLRSQTRRGMSTNSGSPSGSRGAGFLQRMASFGVGAGVTALATQVLILQKLEEANKDMLEKYKSLEARLDKMEKRR